jgi:hypothetical protein
MTRILPPTAFSGVRNEKGVREESLRRYVPSIFAEAPHESRSDRYEFIPTWDVIKAMQAEGFIIVSAQQSRTRDHTKRDFTKHLLRLRHSSYSSKDGSVFELLFKNSHDGSSLYELMAGIYQFICSNGLVIGEHLVEPIKVRHTGNISDDVINASYSVVEQAPKVNKYVEEWKRIGLSEEQSKHFAFEAGKLRWPDRDVLPVSCNQLLHPRRPDDSDSSLWSVFNRVQENCIKGGMQGQTRDSRGRLVMRSVREVKGIDQDIKLNKGLWQLAEDFYLDRKLEVA